MAHFSLSHLMQRSAWVCTELLATGNFASLSLHLICIPTMSQVLTHSCTAPVGLDGRCLEEYLKLVSSTSCHHIKCTSWRLNTYGGLTGFFAFSSASAKPLQISDIASQIIRGQFLCRNLWSTHLCGLLCHYFWIWVNWFFHLFLLLIHDLNPLPLSSMPLKSNHCLGPESKPLPSFWLNALLDPFQGKGIHMNSLLTVLDNLLCLLLGLDLKFPCGYRLPIFFFITKLMYKCENKVKIWKISSQSCI